MFGLVFLHVLDDDRGGVRMCSVLSGLLVVSFRVGRVVFLPSALNCQRGFAICKKGQVFFLCCFAQETVKKEHVRERLLASASQSPCLFQVGPDV